MQRRKLGLAIAAFGAAVVLTWLISGGGVLADPSGLQERAEVLLPLPGAGEGWVEQTFVPQRGDLAAVAVRAESVPGGTPPQLGYRLTRVDGSGVEREIASGLTTAGTVEDAGFAFARFPAQADSSGASYKLKLQTGDTASSDGAAVWASGADVYSDGQAAQAGVPLEGDLVFKLYYRYTLWTFLRDLAGLIPQSGRAVLAAMALLILPGLAVAALLVPRRPGEAPLSLTATSTAILAIGLSAAMCPIALTLATAAGLRISESALWIGLAACGAVAAGRAFQFRKSWKRWCRVSGWEAAVWGLFLASLAVSLIAVREVRYPLWTDSLHHTVITQLIVDRGQIPDSYLPYYPFQQFSYHFGFHSLAAYLSLLAQVPAAQAVILAGQITIPVTGLTVYLMARQLTGKPSLGFFAAVTVLFLNHVPALYVNWGRYTQLAAQMLLPVCVLAIIQALRSGGRFWIVAAGILAAGTFLFHYRVAVFAAFLLLAFGAAYWRDVLSAARRPWVYAGRAAGVAGIAALLSAYWLVPMAAQTFLPFLSTAVAVGRTTGASPNADFLSGVTYDFNLLTGIGANWLVILLAAIGGLIGLWRRDRFAIASVLWIALLFLGANSYRIGLNLYVLTVMIIALYLPLGFLAAGSLDSAWAFIKALGSRWSRAGRSSGMREAAAGIGALAALAAFITLLALNRMGIARLENGFVRSADEKAIEWIQRSLPDTARLFVASEFWVPTIVEGRDAGWWLPYLARRDATVPLQRYINDATRPERTAINQLAKELDHLKQPQQARDILRANGVSHVYIGNRPSSLDPRSLAGAPGYRLVYSRDGVWIYQVE